MTILGIPNADLRGYQPSWVYSRLGSVINLMPIRDYERKITEVLLAVKQFQLQEDRWPKDLQELSRVGLGPNDMKVSKNLPIRYERNSNNSGPIVWRFQSAAELFRATQPKRHIDAGEPKRDPMMIKHHVK